MRRPLWLLALLAALVGAGSAPGAVADLQVDRGIVQSVSPGRIVLRELDGNTASLSVGAATRVRLNGLPATLADIRPGFVAAVVHDGDAPAVLVRAFGVRRLVDRGTIVSFAARRLTISPPTGARLTFLVTLRTRITWRGAPATRRALRPGRSAVVTHNPSGVALRIVVRPPGSA